MPIRPPRPCNHSGCPEVGNTAYCPKHTKERQKEVNTSRGSASSRGYNYRWQKARALYLKQHPLCVECDKDGILKAANVVDHKIPHKGDYGLMWDESNWQSLCKRHHDIKTATEDGGFGR